MNNGHFDILAPIYDRFIRYRDDETMVSLAGLPVEGYLLDAGGGTGRISESLKEYVGQVIVTDLSRPMLQQAAAKDLPVSCAETEILPYPDGCFERIIMVDALHHVTDQHATASELWRVLKPGGRLVVMEPDIDCFLIKLLALFEKVALMRSHFLSKRRMQDVFTFPGSSTKVTLLKCNIWLILDKK